MESKIVEIPPFTIAGITVRTNNNTTAQEDISQLWGYFMGQGLLFEIEPKLSTEIYCVYTDYESDYRGNYTTVIGCKVPADTDPKSLPEGVVLKDIPRSTYKEIEVVGRYPDCVADAWAKIWKSKAKRAYVADFEVYNHDSLNLEKAKVNIYISV